jgi:CTP synthase (UTP-ammonia lyase)
MRMSGPGGETVMQPVRIGLVGDFDCGGLAHRAAPEALRLAAANLGRALDVAWLGTADLGRGRAAPLAGFAGLWCVPGSPYASTEGALAAIQFARESSRPFLGTCGGFQHALLEYVRNVCGQRQADHAELDPGAGMPLIARLACPLVEKAGRVVFVEGSRLRALYGSPEAEEQYHCSYGLNPAYEALLGGTPLRVSGRDPAGEVRAVELDGRPLFVATLFQPERAALRGVAHPLVRGYVAAAAAWAEGA